MRSGEAVSGWSNGITQKLQGERRDVGVGLEGVGALNAHPRSSALLSAGEEAWAPGFAMTQLDSWASYFSLQAKWKR